MEKEEMLILSPARYLVDCTYCSTRVSRSERPYKRLEFALVGMEKVMLFDFYVPPEVGRRIRWKYDQLPYDACTYQSLNRLVGRRFVVEVDVQVFRGERRNRVMGILMEVKK